MEILGYICTFIMGITLGLLGGGGSILTVPILTYLFGINAVNATAYSLFIVGLASAFGAVGKWRDNLVNLKIGIVFAIPGFLGVFLSRALIIPSIPKDLGKVLGLSLTKDLLIMLVFAVMMIIASLSMIRGRKEENENKEENEEQDKSFLTKYSLIGLEGLVVGTLTGFVGAGGGFLIIPALVILTKLPMKVAVGTSLMIIAFKSLFGFVGDVMVNPDIQWGFILLLSLISVIGIFLGSFFSKKVPEKKLKKGFGYFVLVMGTFILIQQLYK